MEKKKANLMLGIINRGVFYKSAEVIPKLNRPHIKYCIQFWTPINVKDVVMLMLVCIS